MNTNNESQEELIILVSAIFSMISFIMSILATTTSGWQIDSHHNKTGLFQICYKDSCTSIREKHNISIIFAIIGQCLIIFGIISSFINVFIYRRRINLIIITIFFFLASLFLWITILTINLYLFMNGGSAIIFNAAIAFSLFATFTASYALGVSFALHHNPKISIKYNQITMPFQLYRNVPTAL
ncbi:unnamed protein product [Rotaria sordida]|uniref:Uncharacterized protein n=1 Tax=Rotaria sordida TaxID=392033 RepID=A0A814C4G1_9BILA|nr:unnamed protein product [Rotaria sordida]CAF0935157.1 unnamed protein product [Rotaria sordida]CAF0936571.1 unnamed protein product [Rotaria sordida]CAF1089403.1 unnamed protein product [Rotaria sordida]CAF1281420.1 unnamed protein product [Rotaria sordida]